MCRTFLFFTVILFTWGVEAPPAVAAAQPGAFGSGQILFGAGQDHTLQAVHLETDLTITVSGIVMSTVLHQSFINQTTEWQEATYVLPLADNAAVNDMEMRTGDRIIRAEIRERQQARKIYEQARQEGRKAALTEQSRQNLFRQTIANIAPGETIVVRLKMVQTVDYNAGVFSLRFPLTLTPRYIPGDPGHPEIPLLAPGRDGWAMATDQVRDAPLITPPMLPDAAAEMLNPVRISVLLDPGLALREINSLYHDVSISRHEARYRIELAEGQVPMDRDFVMTWCPVAGSEPAAAVFREEVEGRDHLLVMVLPPAPTEPIRALPREMLMVIDTSGSMQGTSIHQAKASLVHAIEGLRPEDSFNVIAFNSAWTRLFGSSQSADPWHLQRAKEWVSQLTAGGGTEMLPALQQALRAPIDENRLRHIVFITDGAVGNESALFAAIHAELGNARLFPIGIGSAPNSFLLRQAAGFGRGSYSMIGDVSEVGEKMRELFRRIDSPVITDISVTWPGEVEVYPQRIPDLYMGEPLLVAARADNLAGNIHIAGRSALDEWQRVLSLDTGGESEGTGVIWARAKVQELEDRLVRGADPALVRAEMVETGLAHALITRHTSLVAAEELISRLPGETQGAAAVPNAIPAGQVVNYPRTATNAGLTAVFGLLALMLGVLLWAIDIMTRRGS